VQRLGRTILPEYAELDLFVELFPNEMKRIAWTG
jgi:hypothetical protein